MSAITKLSLSLTQHTYFSLPLPINKKYTIHNLNKSSKSQSTHFSIHIFNKKSAQCSCTTSITIPQPQTGLLITLFQEMGFGESEFRLVLDRCPGLKIASFDSIRSRVVLLESVRICGPALYRLVVKCPSVLVSEEVESLVCFVRDDLEGMVEAEQIERVLGTTEARLLVGFDKKVRLLVGLGVPREKICFVLNNVNLAKAICLKSVEDLERTVSFLDRFGGVELIVRRPRILNFDLDKQLVPRVEFILELSGGDEDATKAVLLKLPAILSYCVEHLKNHAEVLRSCGGLNEQEIFKIFYVFPNVVSASRERKLLPRLGFLKECGFDSNDIYKFLCKAPLFLGLSFEENLAYKLVLLVKIGYEFRTKELAMAMGAVTRTSCENMQKVIGLFLSYGLSSQDILVMSKKHPQILQYNARSLEEKIEYLINDMGCDVQEVLAFPAFLGYKLDERIKLRYEGKKESRGEGSNFGQSQTGYLFTYGGTAISWRSTKQTITATLSNHAEILALHEASRECIWLRSVIQYIRETCGLTLEKMKSTILYEDNTPCITQLKEGYIKGDRTKHISRHRHSTDSIK